MLDVLLPSAYFCDIVFTGLPDIPRLGEEVFSQGLKVMPGAGFIPAVSLTRLGIRVDWACDFGNDFFSRYVLAEVDRQNLSTRLFRKHEQPLQAVSVVYSFAGDRAFLSYIDPLPPTDLTTLVHENPARCLMLMSLHTGSDFIEAAKIAHTQGSLVFMDGQVAEELTLMNLQVVDALQSADIFTLNGKEAQQLTGDQNLESALDRLAALTSTVIIKLGADGAIAKSKGKRVYMPGIPTNVIDTTGAGDNFDCGFLYGLLQGYALEDCVRCGNFCGSRSATVHGGWIASPTAHDLEDYLKQVQA